MGLRNRTTSEFRTVFDSPLGVSNSQVPLELGTLYMKINRSGKVQTTSRILSCSVNKHAIKVDRHITLGKVSEVDI